MSFIEEKTNKTNITRYYETDLVKTDLGALSWIDTARKTDDILVDCIQLHDLSRRSDEGSESTQLAPGISSPELEECFMKREAELISINGKYQCKPVVIGVDLRVHRVYVTVRKKDPADISALEKQLQL